jgi:hypothetical protein
MGLDRVPASHRRVARDQAQCGEVEVDARYRVTPLSRGPAQGRGDAGVSGAFRWHRMGVDHRLSSAISDRRRSAGKRALRFGDVRVQQALFQVPLAFVLDPPRYSSGEPRAQLACSARESTD